ncbi:MAG: SpoIIE family protein phosphatase [Candidatus Aureabacteria bacterium]|nr:SpoIIE family protein phosphatase [Candidatus Auribacterota bacterium]
MLRTRGIAFRLILYIITSCTLIFTVSFGYNYLFSRRIITSKIEENARNLALRTVNRIETVLRSVEKVPQNITYSLESSTYSKEGILNLLRTVVENNPEIYGSTISYEPYAFDKNSRLFGPYYYKPGGKLSLTYLDGNYNYIVWDWYTIPKKLGAPVWTEPYFDKGGGNIIMSTYSVPFYYTVKGKREFAGVVTADVYLSWLQDIVSSIKIGTTGYGFLVSRQGTIVTHPRRDLIMRATLPGIAEARHDAELSAIAREMTQGKSGFVPSTSIVTGKKCWLEYEPIPSTGWSLGMVFPQDELMADVTHLGRMVFLLGMIGIGVLLAVIVAISGSITRPLRLLAKATRDIARGELDFTLPAIVSGDEVGKLAASFLYMRDSLRRYIRELTETTAAKERMESELKIARDIQMGMVPKAFPAFPERDEFDISAVLEPAREVGGDLYDFFFVDETHLCFVIGDVSGKGVPAALFMAMTITLIKAAAREAASPGAILERVNKELAHNNDSCMFVTVFCGVLNVEDGMVRYANAGHNPPLVIREGRDVEFLKGGEGTLLGIEEGSRYPEGEILLRGGDTLAMYTDGVTEAFNREREMFSEERLREEVASHRKDSVVCMIQRVLESVKAHSRGIPQSDDITLLVLRYLRGAKSGAEGNAETRTGESAKGRTGESEKQSATHAEMTIDLKNDLSEIRALAEAVATFGARNRLPDDLLYNMRLAMEEIATNVIRYAYADEGEHRIGVRMALREGELILEVRDDGRPFNPITFPSPDVSAPREERPEGGLGIFLVRNFMDTVEYKRANDENVLVMKKRYSIPHIKTDVGENSRRKN